MNDLIGRVLRFEKDVFPSQSALYGKLATEGQSPTAMIISCADSRVAPEHVLQAAPGEVFVARNAGNIVPPYAQINGGVTSTVEYAVAALGVEHIIVCGHSDCGAMKAVADPSGLAELPNVANWLRHSDAARQVVKNCCPELSGTDKVRAISLENVAIQLTHLRTHPAVAAAIATGKLSLHGWFVDIHAGEVLGLDGETGRFAPLHEGTPLPVALPAQRRVASEALPTAAAE